MACVFLSSVAQALATPFASGAEFRAWLEKHHATASELAILFHNKTSGKGGITYPQALDEALCFGWIDGIIHKIDAQSHTRRFTPRKSGSTWSLVNIRHVQRLTHAGRMRPAGVKAFAARSAKRTGIYSFEQRPEVWPPSSEKAFRAEQKAWAFWQEQPPGYRRVAMWWVISAKQSATRERRLAQLIAISAAGRRLGMK